MFANLPIKKIQFFKDRLWETPLKIVANLFSLSIYIYIYIYIYQRETIKRLNYKINQSIIVKLLERRKIKTAGCDFPCSFNSKKIVDCGQYISWPITNIPFYVKYDIILTLKCVFKVIPKL